MQNLSRVNFIFKKKIKKLLGKTGIMKGFNFVKMMPGHYYLDHLQHSRQLPGSIKITYDLPNLP